LWNNPSIGNVVFGKNVMSFEALSTKVLDYWVVAGDTPAQIVESYADATGKVRLSSHAAKDLVVNVLLFRYQ
jgi:alpha-D-xyloside xylohydrolase